MDNPLFNKILKVKNGHYCHALEIYSIEELESIIYEVINQYKGSFGYTMQDLKVFIEFFSSMHIYPIEGDMNRFLWKDFEEDLYNLNMRELVTEIYKGV